MSQHSKFHQCARCGMTRNVSKLRTMHREDRVLKIDEQVFVCTDEPECGRLGEMMREHTGARVEALLQALLQAMTKPPSKGGRPTKVDLAPVKPLTRQVKPPLQHYPLLGETLTAARKRVRKARR